MEVFLLLPVNISIPFSEHFAFAAVADQRAQKCHRDGVSLAEIGAGGWGGGGGVGRSEEKKCRNRSLCDHLH